MQTFLPYPSFEESARVLDDKRLMKQQVECIQILLALWHPEKRFYGPLFEKMGYKTCDPEKTTPAPYMNHPCTLMWKGHDTALIGFLAALVSERTRRGRHSPRTYKFLATVCPDEYITFHLPRWFGDQKLHDNYKAVLKHKKPEHYGPIWQDIEPIEKFEDWRTP